MADDKTVTTPADQGTAPAAPSAEAAATEPNPGLQWLEQAPPDEIMRNDRIRGIFGSRLQQERESIRRELNEEQDRAARQKAEADLLRLAQENPFEFAQTYLSKAEQERIARETQNLKSATRTEFAQTLGRGYAALPEWSNLNASEQETLARSVVGKTDDDAITAFNAAALDVIAERRATAKTAKWRDTELAKEREAIRQEESAKRVKTSARPSLVGGSQVAPSDPTQLNDKDFNQWYTANVLNRRR